MCIYIYICWLRCLRCIFCIFADWIAECIADFLIFAALVRCFFFCHASSLRRDPKAERFCAELRWFFEKGLCKNGFSKIA